ncbi:MAG TPA: fibronectin type III domain-containing protein [Candidatus Kapabacteria bacterium]|nr:fibronectin type III domain-containing protein [Candidatus Kapabacteria bacterium]
MSGYFLSMPKRLILLVVACASLAGCLSDNSPIVQVVPRLVLAPQNPRFQAIHYFPGSNPPAGWMLVKWNRSIADTQLNFKGYFVELWSSDTSNFSTTGTENLIQLLDSVHIGRVGTKLADTFYTFMSIPSANNIPMGRYTIIVKGEKTAASETLSTDSSQYSALFDPLPLSDPTNLQATSLGPTQIGLRWTPSPDDTSAGFYRYVIYYRDPSKTDTGHIIALIPKLPIFTDTKGVKIGWNDSTYSVGVPGVTGANQTTSEWPYQFWIKSERIDSTFFYTDTNAVIWAGAEQVPKIGNDTGVTAADAGYLRVYNTDTIYFGSLNNQYNVAIDSSKDGRGQVAVTISGNTVTLTATGPDGVGFLARTDQDSSLGLVYYSAPLDDPSQFDQASIQLPSPTNGGVIVYVMMNDDVQSSLGHIWARIFIREQSFGNYINSNGAIDIKASFQPGVTKDGSQHLPYY